MSSIIVMLIIHNDSIAISIATAAATAAIHHHRSWSVAALLLLFRRMVAILFRSSSSCRIVRRSQRQQQPIMKFLRQITNTLLGIDITAIFAFGGSYRCRGGIHVQMLLLLLLFRIISHRRGTCPIVRIPFKVIGRMEFPHSSSSMGGRRG